MKKLILLIISLFLCALTGCGGNKITEDGAKLYRVSFVTVDTGIDGRKTKDTLKRQAEFNEKAAKDFNIEFDYIEIPPEIWTEEINAIFASGKRPDIVTRASESEYKRWGKSEYLMNVDLDNLPNYKALWTEDKLEVLKNSISDNDGSIFYLPAYKQETVERYWSYRADVFTDAGISFPANADSMYNALLRIKANNPDKILMSGAGNGSSALAGIYQMFWMPHNILDVHSYVDPVTNEFVPFAFATDNARDMFKFIHKLYKEDLIDRELLTTTKAQFDRRISTGHIFMYYGSALDVQGFTKSAEGDTPGANWQTSTSAITAYPQKGSVYAREGVYNPSGSIALGVGLNKNNEVLSAVYKYIDWCASNEGQKYVSEQESDVAGVVVPKLSDDVYNQTKGNVLKPLENAITGRARHYTFRDIFFSYTDEWAEEEREYELKMALINIREQYISKFFTCRLDPNNDEHWQRYINDLKKVGLDEFSDIRTRAAGL